jgi:hypothetical protein
MNHRSAWPGTRRVVRLFGAAALVVPVLLLAGSPARAYEHRVSTPSFGAQFGYGRLLGGETFTIKNFPTPTETNPNMTSEWSPKLAEIFDEFGPSAHVSIRFVLDRSHAFGFGFDDIRYKRHAGWTEAERLAVPKWVKFSTIHADYYLYFHRRARISYYLSPSLGIQQREIRYKGSDIDKEEFRLMYGGAGGMEYFISRSFSFDLGGRLYALRGGNGTSLTLQPALGVHIYVI